MAKTKVILAGALTAIIAGTALTPAAMAWPGARSGNDMNAQFLANFDADKDGTVTKAEMETVRAENFAKADASKDGAVDLEEWKVFAAEQGANRGNQMQVRIFQRFDANGDGSVTKEEFLDQAQRMKYGMNRMSKRFKGNRQAPHGTPGKGPNVKAWGGPQDQAGFGPRGGNHGQIMGAMMAQVDTDKDGQISEAEINALADKIFADGALTLDGFKKVTAEFRQPMFVRGFQRLDADGSLTVTKEEFTAQTTANFDRVDRNNDGVVTKADFERGAMRSNKGGKGGKNGWQGKGHKKGGWHSQNSRGGKGSRGGDCTNQSSRGGQGQDGQGQDGQWQQGSRGGQGQDGQWQQGPRGGQGQNSQWQQGSRGGQDQNGQWQQGQRGGQWQGQNGQGPRN